MAAARAVVAVVPGKAAVAAAAAARPVVRARTVVEKAAGKAGTAEREVQAAVPAETAAEKAPESLAVGKATEVRTVVG